MNLASNFPRSSRSLHCDAMLKRIVNMVNVLDVEMGLVLMVPGGVVAGKAISAEKWNEAWKSELRESGPGGSGLAGGIDMLIDKYGFVFDDEFPGVDSLSRIHLKDSSMLSGDKTIPNLLTRVRMEEVSAWSFGAPKPKDA